MKLLVSSLQLYQKETPAQCKTLKNLFFIEHLRETASLIRCNFSGVNGGNQKLLNFWIAAVSHEGKIGKKLPFFFVSDIFIYLRNHFFRSSRPEVF